VTSVRPFSLEHLVREPPEKANGAPPLLLLLHGVGSNEWDLMGLALHLDRRFFVVSARAPMPLGPDAYAWFRVEFTPDGPMIEPGEVEESGGLFSSSSTRLSRLTVWIPAEYISGASVRARL